MPRPMGLVLVLAAMAGCGPVITRTRVELPRGAVSPAGRYVEMHYLGNGGWVFRRGADVVATAPFVTNPSGLGVYFFGTSDVERVRQRVPEMSDVRIMLIGHSHYDHAMDLPAVLRERAPNARLYGSTTVGHLFAKALDPPRLEVVDEPGEAAVGDVPGRWFPDENAPVRFMPLTSNHAPHLCGAKLVSSEKLTEDLPAPPSIPACWPEGETLAYLIDFLRPDGSVEFRIYYQDAAASPGMGGIPELPKSNQAPVDVAILCVAGFAEVDDSPGWIVRNLQPRTILGGHWEDFFLFPSDDAPRVAPGTSLDGFITGAQAAHPVPVQIPALLEKVYFPLDR